MSDRIGTTWQFPNLFQVFGGYLNQDFDLDYPSADAALEAAAVEYDDLSGALRELDLLLASELDSRALNSVVERLTTGYSPVLDGWEIRPWLEHARTILAAHR